MQEFEPCPADICKNITSMLRKFKTPGRLRSEIWLPQAQMQQYLAADPGMTSAVALARVCDAILEELRTVNTQYAFILHQRFWEQHKAEDVAEMQEIDLRDRRFRDIEREAITQFAAIIWTREETAKHIASSQQAEADNQAVILTSEARLYADDADTSLIPVPAGQHTAAHAERTDQARAPSSADQTPAVEVHALVASTAQPIRAGQRIFGPLRHRQTTRLMLVVLIVTGALIYGVTQQARREASGQAPTTQTQPQSAQSKAQALSKPAAFITATAALQPDGSACQGARKSIKDQFTFLEVGAAFSSESTGGVLPNNTIRALAPAHDGQGLWLAYFKSDQNFATGLAFFNNDVLEICPLPDALLGININALALDGSDQLWLATEGGGVARYAKKQWTLFTKKADHLPSDMTFGLTIDAQDHVWVATQAGVAEYDGTGWQTQFSLDNAAIQYEGVHAVTFTSSGDRWIGMIDHGIRRYAAQHDRWISYTTADGIGGNQIRAILRQSSGNAEVLWFASADGGITRWQNDQWTVFDTTNGLPSNTVQALASDRLNRVWAATAGGVVYFEAGAWHTYNHISTLSLAFGSLPDATCPTCPVTDDHVWTGTQHAGLTHARIPLVGDGVHIAEVCATSVVTSAVQCQPVPKPEQDNTITITLTQALAPGTEFRLATTVTPLHPFNLQNGDLLKNTDGNLYGAWLHMAVDPDITVRYGTPYTFKNTDAPFVAPELAADERERRCVTTWRVWMGGRFVGPALRIVFLVKRP